MSTQQKRKIKKGDTIVVVTGKDKGKQGAVLKVIPVDATVVVDGIGMVKRSLRKTGRNQSGRIVERPRPIHISNVMVLDPETKKPSRVKREVREGKRVRVTVKGNAKLS